MWALSGRKRETWLSSIWRRLRYIFVSVFTSKCSSHLAQVTDGKGRELKNEEQLTVREDQVQDHIRNLKVHKSMGHDEVHLWVLKEVADEVATPLLPIIYEKSCQSGEVHGDGKRRSITPILKRVMS